MSRGFLDQLDLARKLANTAFTITSGYRCPTYNVTIGGSPQSAHITGYAADIHTPGSHSRFLVLRGLIDAGFKRIGVGPDFIHVDSDPNLPDEVVWDYYK
jgi:uncharacterized protein YcbK (DUF882 family)